jgi:DNA-binding transcriptional LysR family regulator
VDPHLLRTFVTVVRLGSFSAAAAELGYTQAAVSQQIAALESDLKVTLLNRRPVTPTEAGARLLEHADPILLRLDAARADITRMTQAPAAMLVVSTTALAATGIAGALAALRQQLPRIDVTVQLGSRSEVTTGVARGVLDIGLVDGLTAPGDSLPLLAPLYGVGVAEAEVVLVLPNGHPLAGRATVRLVDLADARWIDAPNVAPSLSDVRRVAGVDGFRPALTYEGPDTLTLIRLAAAGHGLTLLPTSVAAQVRDIVTVRVGAPPLAHRVERVHGTLREASPAAVLADLL